MPPAGFEPAIPAGKRLQTHALDRSATGIGQQTLYRYNNLLGETLHFHAAPLLRVQDSRPVNLLASWQKKNCAIQLVQAEYLDQYTPYVSSRST